MIRAVIPCGNVAETCGDVRRRIRKSLKLLCGNILRKRAETAETLTQVIEIIAETETETSHPPTEGVRAGARAHAGGYARTRSKTRAKLRSSMT